MIPLYHPSIDTSVRALRVNLPHASLITGKSGVGSKSIAQYLAGSSLSRVVQPELLTKTSTVPQISVEVIRNLYQHTRTKSDSRSVIIIDDADMMTQAAQNSFLKLLEEPNQYTHFILTSHTPERLLPTVRSRAQTLHLPLISPEQSKLLVDSFDSFDGTKKAQVKFIADGLPAEITRLAADAKYFEGMVRQTTAAKQLIEARRQDVLALVLKNTPDRSAALLLVERALHLLSLKPTPQSVERTSSLLNAYESIRVGGNIRLQLAEAML